MNANNLIAKIQSITKVTRAELAFVTFIVLGLGIALIINGLKDDDPNHISKSELINVLDSLSGLQKTSFTGSDIYDNTNEELAKADTIIDKKILYPKKKETKSPDILDLNSASKTELMSLPGVGAKTALKIIEYRKSYKFNTIEEIQNVKGIGPKKFDKMKAYIKVN